MKQKPKGACREATSRSDTVTSNATTVLLNKVTATIGPLEVRALADLALKTAQDARRKASKDMEMAAKLAGEVMQNCKDACDYLALTPK